MSEVHLVYLASSSSSAALFLDSSLACLTDRLHDSLRPLNPPPDILAVLTDAPPDSAVTLSDATDTTGAFPELSIKNSK